MTSTLSRETISPLRRRMIEDMTVRRIGEKTQSDYIRHVKNFSLFLGRSPHTATPEDLRRYQVHQSQAGVQPPTMNGTVAALRFFFKTTLDQPDMGRHLTLVRQPRKMPVVLDQDEVARLLEAAPGPKYKPALGVAYGAGLRVSEVANLKVSDIDSKGMRLRIEQGKGSKDRHAMLSPRLVELLRDWCVPISRRRGCFPAAIRCCRSRHASSTGWSAIRPPPSRSRSGCRRTRSGTASRRTCSNRASIFA